MKLKFALFGALTATIAGAALAQSSEPPGGKYAKEAEQMFRTSFKAENPKYWMNRLEQDETMKTCQQYRDNPPRKIGEKLEKLNAATIRYPVDGKLIGDWKEGEKLAAVCTGGHIGFIQPDPPGRVRGGNCYACHELAKKEVAYGTIGPSLQHFGKLRGYTDEMRRYAWGKVWNSEAFNACTNMPRFGHNGILTEQQVRDVVALLMDPASPVNQ